MDCAACGEPIGDHDPQLARGDARWHGGCAPVRVRLGLPPASEGPATVDRNRRAERPAHMDRSLLARRRRRRV